MALSEFLPLLLGPYGVAALLAFVAWTLWKELKATRKELKKETEFRLADAQKNTVAMEQWNEVFHETVDRLASIAEEMGDRVSRLPCEDLPNDPHLPSSPSRPNRTTR